jgi:hypothetical protein
MASRFWVGGTGTWDASDTTHWSATSGGAGGASVPGSADTVTFNGSSGGGTVTVNTTVNVQSITCGAFTGTLDFSVNNNNVTLSANTAAFDGSGSGARTIKLGNGTWTFSSAAAASVLWSMGTTTNLTFDAGQSTLDFTGVTSNGATRTFAGGGLTYANVRFRGQANGASTTINGANTFGQLTVDGMHTVILGANQTITTLTVNGTGSGPVLLKSSADNSQRTLTVASNAPTINYAALRDINCTGGATFVANNSFDFGDNSGVTINGPSGGGHIASRQRLGM